MNINGFVAWKHIAATLACAYNICTTIMRGNCCNYWTIDAENINLRQKKAETLECKGFESWSANPNYWTIDAENINLRQKKAETLECKGFENWSANPNYWTIDAENINNRKTDRYSYRTCSAFESANQSRIDVLSLLLCNKANINTKS